MLQFQTSSASDGNGSRLRELNRLSCRQRNEAKSLSTTTADTRSSPAPRSNAQSLPTFTSSLSAPRADGRSMPTRGVGNTACHDVSAKKRKVEVGLTEDVDDFENDWDSEMMMMMAQTTEHQNSTHSSSSSSSSGAVDNSGATQTNSRCNISSVDTALVSSHHVSQATDSGRSRYVAWTASCTGSDSGVNYSSMSYNVSGSRQSTDADKHGFTNRDVMDVTHCVTDTDIKDVTHRKVEGNNSVSGNADYCSGNVASPGTCTLQTRLLSFVPWLHVT